MSPSWWSKASTSLFPKKAPIVNAVSLQGMIAARAGPRGLSFASIAPYLEKAFKSAPHPPDAVALVVNSPGGSPVQSNLIGQLIEDLRAKHKVPVISFAEDVAASGGYWLLCGGEEIFADKASIVGSIGVVSGGFGVHELAKKWGVERRLHTAGVSKARLDPFLPARPEDVAHLQETLGEIHEVFKAHVTSRRGSKIAPENKEVVFSGDFFTGQKGVELGLVDGIGSLHQVAKEKFGDKVKVNLINARPRFPLFPWMGASLSSSALAPGAAGSSLAAHVTDHMLAAVEERLEERLWRARLGL